jgi:hypothetical protein
MEAAFDFRDHAIRAIFGFVQRPNLPWRWQPIQGLPSVNNANDYG